MKRKELPNIRDSMLNAYEAQLQITKGTLTTILTLDQRSPMFANVWVIDPPLLLLIKYELSHTFALVFIPPNSYVHVLDKY